MKQLWMLALACLVGLAFPQGAAAQYNLEELGMEVGPGFAMLQNTSTNALGPGGNVNVFFSHYACGKGYGFHITAGATALFPSTQEGQLLIDEPAAGSTRLQFAGLDVGFMGKLRIHEYHRPREWAVFLGPKLLVPVMARAASDAGSGPLDDQVRTVNHFWTGAQLSVQFRRPISKKKSWFIHPGVEYYFLPAFSSSVAGDAKPLYIFLNFGFAFWDQRG